MSQLDDNNHQVVHSVDKTLKLKKNKSVKVLELCLSSQVTFKMFLHEHRTFYDVMNLWRDLLTKVTFE